MIEGFLHRRTFPESNDPNSFARMSNRTILAPGNIYKLGSGPTALRDPGSHRHAVLATHPQGTATLVYGSSSDYFQRRRCPSRLVTPTAENQLSKPTYFYGTALIVLPQAHLPPSRGRLGADFVFVRNAVKAGLGYRTASCNSLGVGVASNRGRLAVVATSEEKEYGTPHFLILTAHAYSVQHQHQVVVPLYTDIDRSPTGDAVVIEISASMRQAFGPKAGKIFTSGQLVHSVWERDVIHSFTRYSFDTPVLEAIEDSVCAALSL
jgi:hypothetical protein